MNIYGKKWFKIIGIQSLFLSVLHSRVGSRPYIQTLGLAEKAYQKQTIGYGLLISYEENKMLWIRHLNCKDFL